VSRHVEQCEVCQTLARDLEDPSVAVLTTERYDRILQRVHTEAGSARAIWRTWRVAAAACLTVVAGSLMLWQLRSGQVQPGPQEGPVEPLPEAPSVFRIDKPGMNRAGQVEVRAPGSASEAERAGLLHALEPYRANDFAEVARRLTALVERYPDSAAASYHLGVSYLFLGQDAEAARALETAERLSTDENLRREASWHLALVYRRTGRAPLAEDRLKALCRERTGAGWERACAGVRELAVRHRLFGVVTAADGRPLAGAAAGEYVVRIRPETFVGSPTTFSTITGADGSYSVSGLLYSPAKQVLVRAAMPGYFTAIKVVPLASEMRVDLTLDPLVYISLGTTVKGTLDDGDATCGDPTERCERFALTVSGDGILEVTVGTTRRDDVDLHLEAPDGDVFGPHLRDPLRLAIPASANATYQIRIIRYADGPRDFTLATRLQ
jgi:hypothetical protein